MYINQIFELSMVLDNDKFHKDLSRAHKRTGCLEEKDGEYVDQSMEAKGMTVAYRDSQYKKKVKVVINSGRVMDYDKTEPDKFLRKIDKRMGKYFDHKYSIDDFSLSGVTFAMDIDVDSRESVSAYLKVLRRVGRVKGFKPVVYECFEDIGNFCLEGNSNGIEFLLYNIEDYVARRYKEGGDGRKKLKGVLKESEGVLRAEVRLMKPKAIRDYTDATDIREQIADLMKNRNDIFLEIFAKIVPFGNFYKKDKAAEIICGEIGDGRLRRRMLRLVALIPEKKSLCLAQKAMEYISLRYAVAHKLILLNPAEGINLPKTVESKPYHTRNIDVQKTLTMEQMQILLEASKETSIHMQVLFNVLMGLRRQKINGLKYSDVDYINRTLSVERQLGKELNRMPNAVDDELRTKRELPLKTVSSKRVLPIPDYVFEAILEERKVYESNRSHRKSRFSDLDYICCSKDGKPRSKDYHWKHYKNLLRRVGLPDIRWHDLRSTYCTLLLKSDFNPKAISKLMGHAKELVTVDIYGDNSNIIPEEIPELLAYMKDVMPPEGRQKGSDANVLDTVIDTEMYLPEK